MDLLNYASQGVDSLCQRFADMDLGAESSEAGMDRMAAIALPALAVGGLLTAATVRCLRGSGTAAPSSASDAGRSRSSQTVVDDTYGKSEVESTAPDKPRVQDLLQQFEQLKQDCLSVYGDADKRLTAVARKSAGTPEHTQATMDFNLKAGAAIQSGTLMKIVRECLEAEEVDLMGLLRRLEATADECKSAFEGKRAQLDVAYEEQRKFGDLALATGEYRTAMGHSFIADVAVEMVRAHLGLEVAQDVDNAESDRSD